jgi:hypothetical protein
MFYKIHRAFYFVVGGFSYLMEYLFHGIRKAFFMNVLKCILVKELEL